MNKLVLKRVLLFVGLLIMSLLVFPGVRILRELQVLVLCEGGVSAQAWLDENGNGQRESNEVPLKGVCVWGGDSFYGISVPDASKLAQICDKSKTDSQGMWPNREGGCCFMMIGPGTCCWNVYVFAKPPEGYRATTPLVVHSCYAQFGVVPKGSSPQLSNEDYIRMYTGYFQAQQIVVILVILAEVILSAVVSIKLVRT